MAASREDAQMVSLKQDVATMIQALPAMAMSQGADSIRSFDQSLTLSGGAWKAIRHFSGDSGTLENAKGDKDESIEGAANIASRIHLDDKAKSACIVARIFKATASEPKRLSVWSAGGKCEKIMPAGTVYYPLEGAGVQF